MTKSNEELIEKLKMCENIDLDKLDINNVNEDITDIKVDKNKTSLERILEFIQKAKNPYLYKNGDFLVKVEFSNNGVYAEECINNVFRNMYS